MKRVCLILIAFAFILVSCTSAPPEEPEAKTINVIYANQAGNKRHFEYVKQAFSAKFPNYEFRYIEIDNYNYYDDQSALRIIRFDYPGLEEVGVIPDLIIEIVQGGTSRIFTQDYTYNLESSLRTANIDLSSFDAVYVDHIRAMSPDGSLRALPLSVELYALGYPPDAISADQLADVRTWADLADFSRRVPLKSPDTFQYYWYPMAYQFGLSYWNAQDQVDMNQESWELALSTIKQLNFSQEAPYTLIPLSTLDLMYDRNMEIDLHPLPRVSKTDDAGANRLYQLAAVGPSSNKVDAVMQLIAYLTSYEFQLGQVRQGVGSVLNRDEMHEQLGADNPNYSGKNVEAFFALRPSKVPTVISKYDRPDWKYYYFNQAVVMYSHIDPFIRQMIKDDLDPGTAFEAIQKQMATFEKYILGLSVTGY